MIISRDIFYYAVWYRGRATILVGSKSLENRSIKVHKLLCIMYTITRLHVILKVVRCTVTVPAM